FHNRSVSQGHMTNQSAAGQQRICLDRSRRGYRSGSDHFIASSLGPRSFKSPHPDMHHLFHIRYGTRDSDVRGPAPSCEPQNTQPSKGRRIIVWRAHDELGRTSERSIDDRDLAGVLAQPESILSANPQNEKTRLRRPRTVVTHALAWERDVTHSSDLPSKIRLTFAVLFVTEHDRSRVVSRDVRPRLKARLDEEMVEV